MTTTPDNPGIGPIDVRLRAEWVENVGYRYDVLLDGETIVCRSRDPEYDAARVLQARGLRGHFRTIDFVTGQPRMIVDIEKAAGLRVVEEDLGGLKIGLYRQMSDQDKARLANRSHRGLGAAARLQPTVSHSCRASRTAFGHPNGSLHHPSVTNRTISGPDRSAGHRGDSHDAH